MLSHVINALNFREWPRFVDYARLHFPGAEIFFILCLSQREGRGA